MREQIGTTRTLVDGRKAIYRWMNIRSSGTPRPHPDLRLVPPSDFSLVVLYHKANISYYGGGRDYVCHIVIELDVVQRFPRTYIDI